MKESGVSFTPYYNTTDKEICSVLMKKIYIYREKIIVYLRSKEESHGGATEVGCSPTFVR